MRNNISNIKETHDPAGYPLAESESIISGTEAGYVIKPRLKGINEHVFNSDDNTDKTKTIAQERKDTPVYSGVLKYFPNALREVSRVSKAGNDQHHPDKPLHWDMDKSKDELDALSRHLIDHSADPVDTDGILHLGKVAWRALAALERYLTDKN